MSQSTIDKKLMQMIMSGVSKTEIDVYLAKTRKNYYAKVNAKRRKEFQS